MRLGLGLGLGYPRRGLAGLPGVYSLVMSRGILRLVGNASHLLASRSISMGAGLLDLVGRQASLKAARGIQCAPGLLALSGEEMIPTTEYRAPLDSGVLALTGQAAGLRATRGIQCAPAVLHLAGQPADLVYSGGEEEPEALGLVPLTSASVQRTNGQSMTATTPSFTPAAGKLLIIVAGFNAGHAVTAGTPAITDSLGAHLTYTSRHASTPQYLDTGGGPVAPSYYGRIAVWTAIGGGAEMTITVTSTEVVNADQGHILISVFEVTGDVDMENPIGAVIANATPGDGALSLTLSAAPAASSLIVAMRMRQDNDVQTTGATPGDGWEEIHDLASESSGYMDLQTMFRPPGSTSDQVSWADTSANASASSWLRHSFAMAIKAAA